ncbi:sigma factor-like helix-turn-helix DNA-binding protein [Polyangium jinanense]|uniref:RNA polymerase sigma factor 70 region 4 type 2 domain-containing protein n=1 Tax=Polyangium jinanense TaxID=2829994 RepID=A0A9X3X6J4_9BACT|nr:sigma factor-like helix-turn-helix DNA-binding protein [Polyangium jinanense]MDC3984587.1 hypothetical protein [Polyangium jinanense]
MPTGTRFVAALALLEALDELRDEATRRMVIANKVPGYTEPEIAELFGMPVGTVHARISRACVKLAKRLRANDERQERRGVLLLPSASSSPAAVFSCRPCASRSARRTRARRRLLCCSGWRSSL